MARPIRHGETKSKKTITITEPAWERLDEVAREFMLSRSELVEMIGQGRLVVVHRETVKSA